MYHLFWQVLSSLFGQSLWSFMQLYMSVCVFIPLGMKMVSRQAVPPTARKASWEILRERLRVKRVMVRAGISTRPKIIWVR